MIPTKLFVGLDFQHTSITVIWTLAVRYARLKSVNSAPDSCSVSLNTIHNFCICLPGHTKPRNTDE